ncbi:hypothetical protein EDC26_10765 [Paralcaligenes ureilyticus]|uniref:Uncharacterized protein n=1 Tax=Paralcaligenes ureilyticus TaxID=627131 RepID=A0A4R3M1Q5_9BURK|nr:hypothetical protein EDC26_10765 [Paralcaligenes ureilyticus]
MGFNPLRSTNWMLTGAPHINGKGPGVANCRRGPASKTRSPTGAAVELLGCGLIQACRFLFSIGPFPWLIRPVIHAAATAHLALVVTTQIVVATRMAGAD